MITMVCAATLYILSGVGLGISDCWDYLKALKNNKHNPEDPQ